MQFEFGFDKSLIHPLWYTQTIGKLLRNGRVEHAFKVFEELRGQADKHGIADRVYAVQLVTSLGLLSGKGCLQANHYFEELLAELTTADPSPKKTYGYLLRFAIEAEDWQRVEELCVKLGQEEVRLRREVYHFADAGRGLSRHGQTVMALQLLETCEMEESLLALSDLIQVGNEEAFVWSAVLIYRMYQAGIDPRESTGALMGECLSAIREWAVEFKRPDIYGWFMKEPLK